MTAPTVNLPTPLFKKKKIFARSARSPATIMNSVTPDLNTDWQGRCGCPAQRLNGSTAQHLNFFSLAALAQADSRLRRLTSPAARSLSRLAALARDALPPVPLRGPVESACGFRNGPKPKFFQRLPSRPPKKYFDVDNLSLPRHSLALKNLAFTPILLALCHFFDELPPCPFRQT